MKLFAFTDIHGDKKAIKSIIKKVKSSNPDILICSGDLTNFSKGLQKLINKFKETKLPLLIIPGNHETNSDLEKACKKTKFAVNIHKRSYQINDYIFFGFGLGGFSKVQKDLEKIIPKIQETTKKKKLIIITHQPPYKTKLDNLHKTDAGSSSIKKLIQKTKPILSICGHIHENENKKDNIGKTHIINPGKNGKFIKI